MECVVMIINKIQNTHFSENETVIVRLYIKKVENIKSVTIMILLMQFIPVLHCLLEFLRN